MRNYVIETINITKRFSRFNPGPNSNAQDMWFDYLMSLLTKRWKGHFVSKRADIIAVDHINLQVYKGEFFGILGPNGAGKTTLIKMLSSILTPSEGTAKINGYDLLKENNQVKASVNVVQSGGWLGFDYAVSIKWSLEFWAKLYGLSGKEAQEKVKKALKIVQLEEKAEEQPGSLSSGMRQRLAIAKGLLVYTPIFLLDELTVGLDSISANHIRDFIKHELNQKMGQTVIFTTHIMSEAEQLCDRVAILNKGKVSACNTPQNLKKELKGHRILLLELKNINPSVVEKLNKQEYVERMIDRVNEDKTGTLRIQIKDSDEIEKKVLDFLIGENCKIISRKIDEPNLEDVFIYLTGRRL